MWNRLLLAIDQYDTSNTALNFGVELARATGADVRVLHVRELSMHPRLPPIETPADAQLMVDEALFALRIAGVGAEGRACSDHVEQVARRIVAEAQTWHCEAIVLGSRRLCGVDRLSGRGTRERVLRASRLPVLTAPAPCERVASAEPGRPAQPRRRGHPHHLSRGGR